MNTKIRWYLGGSREQAIKEVSDGNRKVGHLQSLHVACEDVLGRSHQHLGDGDRVNVAQLRGN